MKCYNESLTMKLETKRGFSVITENILSLLEKSNIRNGLILCQAMDDTTGLFVHINNEKILQDIDVCLHKLAPEKPYKQYAFNEKRTDAAAHIKSHLMGRTVNVAVKDGLLVLPENNEILFADFDGGKDRNIFIQIMGE